MSSPTRTIIGRLARRAPIATAAVLFASGLMLAASASAGTYPMYQCSGAHPSVAPGWSVYGADTTSSTVLSDTCGSGGAIGLYVYANNVPGEFTNAAPGGGSVGLGVNVDGPPAVTIAAVSAQVTVSPNSGDVAFLGFNSSGTLLPGMVELPYEAAEPYVTTDSWTLPTGATNFTAFVNCSTEKAQPACYFPESTEVPALNDITITLADSVPPSLSDISGTLATAAAHSATVSGAQTIGFTGTDMNSGVRSATLTLTPQNGEAPYTHTFSFAAACTYESWNACLTSENVGPFALETASLSDDTYSVSIAVTDAAGNVTSEGLGTITTRNAVNTSLGTLPGAGVASYLASSGAGSPNGSGASENAHLQLGVRSPISRSYGKRALRVSGRLLGAQGLPIAGATLDVLQQVDGASLELVGACAHGRGWHFHRRCAGGAVTDDRDCLPRVLGRQRLHGDREAARGCRRGRAARREPPQDWLGRHDHAERAGARAGPVAGRRRRAARPLPRALGAVPRPTHRLTRAVPGRLPIPGRNRTVPIPGGGVREPGRLPIRTRRKQGGRCHHELSSAETSCPERWSS